MALVLTSQAEALLTVRSPPTTADALVVLGGESWTRPGHAAALYAAGVTPLVIVTGSGDWDDSRRILEARNVPPQHIQVESRSTTTRENALFSIPLLRAAGAKRVVIVTSWYHSRRALDCFRKYGPEMTFYSCPTSYHQKSWWPRRYELRRIWQEYAKTLVYWVRWRVSPF